MGTTFLLMKSYLRSRESYLKTIWSWFHIKNCEKSAQQVRTVPEFFWLITGGNPLISIPCPLRNVFESWKYAQYVAEGTCTDLSRFTRWWTTLLMNSYLRSRDRFWNNMTTTPPPPKKGVKNDLSRSEQLQNEVESWPDCFKTCVSWPQVISYA